MGIRGTSKELQEITMIGLLNDPYLLSKCIPQISEKYFDDKSYKLIYRCLKDYYDKYMKIPSNKELLVVVEENHKDNYGKIEDIKNNLLELYKSEVPDENFVYEKVTEFIRRNNIEQSLGRIVDSVKGGEVDLDAIASDLKSSLSLSLSKSQLYNLSDLSKVKEVREESLGSVDSPLLIKFFIDPVNWLMQYKAIPPGTVNMIVAPPGRGKTTVSINQGLYGAQQGFNSLHIFLGDMKRFDGLLRYLSCLSGIPTSKLVDLDEDKLTAVIKKFNMSGVLGNIYVLSHAADEVSPSQLIEEVIQLQRDNKIHFHQIIIDYDENFASDTDSMYESGGNVYNKIALFAVLNKSVIFILCQPKPAYWNHEIIPLEASAESSKKQKIVDLMLTVGRPSKDSSVGTLNIAKNRRGSDSKYVRLKFIGENARVEAITEEQYNIEKSRNNSDSKRIDDK